MFGSIIAKTVNESGNAEIHYDQALSTNTDVPSMYKTSIISWRDLE